MSIEAINSSESVGCERINEEDSRREGMHGGRVYHYAPQPQIEDGLRGPYPYFPPAKPSDTSEKSIVMTFILLSSTGLIGGHDFYAGRYARTAAKIMAWPIGLILVSHTTPLLVVPGVFSLAYPIVNYPLDFLRLLTGNYQDGEEKYIK
ncbi:MAG: hypothetical protein HRU43_05910 [Simkaniaceae bacterium]|nr:hypothetical protein [Simkaniaceae bacterium]